MQAGSQHKEAQEPSTVYLKAQAMMFNHNAHVIHKSLSGLIFAVLTSVEGVRVFQVALLAETFQPVICDLQYKAAVYHAVGRLQVAVGDDDTVVKERHSLSCESRYSYNSMRHIYARQSSQILMMYSFAPALNNIFPSFPIYDYIKTLIKILHFPKSS